MKQMKIGVVLLVAATACGTRPAHESEALTTNSTQSLFATSASNYFWQTGSDLAAISRGTNLLDLFRIDGGGLKLQRWDGTTWLPDRDLGKPPGVAYLWSVGAIQHANRTDVFAVGNDNHIWRRSAVNAANVFSAWRADVPGNPIVMDASSLAVASWEPGRIDLFWWTPTANIGHAWYVGNLAQGAESGDTPEATWLQRAAAGVGDLSAISPTPGVIHLVYVSDTRFAHHWFNGSWGSTEAPNRESWQMYFPSPVSPPQGAGGSNQGLPNTLIYGSSASITSTGPSNLEIFVRGVPEVDPWQPHIYHNAFNGQWDTATIDGKSSLVFEEVSHPDTQTPLRMCTAIQWNPSTPRMDLYGLGSSGNVWQAVQ
jgi:hypothetical protein